MNMFGVPKYTVNSCVEFQSDSTKRLVMLYCIMDM
jgi:hypothetical protein